LVSKHLAECAACRAELEQLVQLGERLSLLQDIEVRPYFATRVRQRIADRKQRARRGWLPKLAIPVSAAAVVVLMALAGNQVGSSLFERRAASIAQAGRALSGPDEAVVLEAQPGASLLQVSDRLVGGGDNE
jgi:hypothetical protein